MKGIKLSQLCRDLELTVVSKSSDYEDIFITNSQVNRPGIQLAGFYEQFPFKRLQVIGKTENVYLKSLSDELKYERIEGIMSYDIPCLIYSHWAEIPQYVIELAEKHNRTLVRSDRPTTRLISKIDEKLDYVLSEEVTMHAGLMEIYGVGVLIVGKSSVGKSETALDLIIRGHRLVADDVVEVRKLETGLVGQAPKNIRHFLEIRGIGILDIQRLYGVGSIKSFTNIDMVVSLEQWDDDKEYDRLGIDDNFTEILGVQVNEVTIPVKPGRNVAMIVEVAVRNYRQRSLGYNAALELNKRLFASMESDARS
ncbi:HPr(Ser) kinase/phosphatase [Miniphocaeibacter massiliensis]|uniref:HPr(Ser) kinase/phosphatase n=1 Tax=Miniphocaeibacter massiliensis TaxID=2041841 RepID=UPI000C06D941|nr:HPr(Ser) kinase/phosphatase [Miniphocaeibacter massiliensis]